MKAADPDDIAILTRGLVKDYVVTEKEAGFKGALRGLIVPRRKTVHAVSGIDLEVRRGEIVGYLGPNGAGKSTTIKMLCGILQPTAGEVRIDGLCPRSQRQEVARRIGVVFGQRTQLYWDLRLGESFELLRRIYRIKDESFRDSMGWLSEALGLNAFIDQPVRTLSLGQRMRGEIAAALIHSPAILFLDEPTIGLDVEAKQKVREFILRLNETHRTTVLLTSHDLDDVEKLCRRLVVINHGIVVEDGPLEGLINRLAPYRVLVVDCENEGPVPAIEGVEVTKQEGRRLWLQFDRTRFSAPEIIRRVSGRISIRELSVQEPNIEELVKHVYARGPER